MVRIVNGEVVPDAVLRRNSASSLQGTPLLQGSSSNTGSAVSTPAMAPLSLGAASVPHSAHSTPPLHPVRAHSYSNSHSRGTSPAPFAASSRAASFPSASGAPPPLSLGLASAQSTNPYLSHTSFGQSAVTSGHAFSPTPSPLAPAEQEQQHQEQPQLDWSDTARHQHAVQQFQQAAAAAAAAAYYPFHMLHGFMGLQGPGFILGGPEVLQQQQHAQQTQQPQQQQQTASTQTDATDAPHALLDPSDPSSSSSSTSPSSLPVLGVSSATPSCPTLLAATAERRRSKPHIQFVPPTHTLAPGTGMVVPLPVVQQPVTDVPPPARKSSRVPQTFNLFGLPPLLVYGIHVPPHVYLLVALVLYLAGPPALVPLVAAFFFYRWHLAQKEAREAHHRALQHAHAAQHAQKEASTLAAAATAAAFPPKHPAFPSSSSSSRRPSMGTISTLPGGPGLLTPGSPTATSTSSAAPSPSLKPRRHPSNIHSLYD